MRICVGFIYPFLQHSISFNCHLASLKTLSWKESSFSHTYSVVGSTTHILSGAQNIPHGLPLRVFDVRFTLSFSLNLAHLTYTASWHLPPRLPLSSPHPLPRQSGICPLLTFPRAQLQSKPHTALDRTLQWVPFSPRTGLLLWAPEGGETGGEAGVEIQRILRSAFAGLRSVIFRSCGWVGLKGEMEAEELRFFNVWRMFVG